MEVLSRFAYGSVEVLSRFAYGSLEVLSRFVSGTVRFVNFFCPLLYFSADSTNCCLRKEFVLDVQAHPQHRTLPFLNNNM